MTALSSQVVLDAIDELSLSAQLDVLLVSIDVDKSISDNTPRQIIVVGKTSNNEFVEITVASGTREDAQDFQRTLRGSKPVELCYHIEDRPRLVVCVTTETFTVLKKKQVVWFPKLRRRANREYERCIESDITSVSFLRDKVWESVVAGTIEGVEIVIHWATGECRIVAEVKDGLEVILLKKRVLGRFDQLFSTTYPDNMLLEYLVLPYERIASDLAEWLGVSFSRYDQ